MKPCANSIDPRQQRYLIWLIVLLGLFALRVIAQPLALQWPEPLLPSFDDWHSAALPYPLLLLAQCAILVTGLIVIWRFRHRQLNPRPMLGGVVYRLGWIYWSVMVARLLFGVTVFRDVHWFTQVLPALFHLLLANFLMLVGDYLRSARYQAIQA